ncbi:MAG TPA: sulfatase [Pyrinomonadaceae bacterium]|jgi:arylsulfatase A-like enzyme|nr:sulfatase [Pyrinomonadaceae bacterium]
MLKLFKIVAPLLVSVGTLLPSPVVANQRELPITSSPAPSATALIKNPPAKRRRPNFVLIVTDDMGWADLGVYGSAFHQTPNINALAARGVRFTDAYAAAPVCSPSRASLLTGKYPARLQLTDWLPGRTDRPSQKLLRPPIRQALPLAETTIAEALKPAGYVSAHIGKWHLGGSNYGPESQGFDLNIAGDHTGTPASYFYPFRNGDETMPGLAEGRDGEYLTDRLTDEAEKFIEQNHEKPFFLYLAHYAVHIPLKAKPEVIARYRNRTRTRGRQANAIYAAMVESVDESVGRIVRKLAQLKIADDTIIVFTSDNGGLSVEEGPNTPATSNAPLRDGKGYLYEGGIRVPLIVRWPSVTRPGVVCPAPVSGVDIFPTILAMAGVTPSAIEGVDGASLIPLLSQPRSARRRPPIYWHYPHYSNQGGRPGGAVRDGDYKLIEFYEDDRVELYDLRRDAGETMDLSGKLTAKARGMRRMLADWRRRVGAQLMKPNPRDRADERGRRVNRTNHFSNGNLTSHEHKVFALQN